jgi:hypothetical protein
LGVVLQNLGSGRWWNTLVVSSLCNLCILSTLFQASGLFCNWRWLTNVNKKPTYLRKNKLRTAPGNPRGPH